MCGCRQLAPSLPSPFHPFTARHLFPSPLSSHPPPFFWNSLRTLPPLSMMGWPLLKHAKITLPTEYMSLATSLLFDTTYSAAQTENVSQTLGCQRSRSGTRSTATAKQQQLEQQQQQLKQQQERRKEPGARKSRSGCAARALELRGIVCENSGNSTPISGSW